MGRPYRIDTHQHIVPPGYARWMHETGIRPGGFGILLTKNLVDDLLYNERGNAVLFVKYL